MVYVILVEEFGIHSAEVAVYETRFNGQVQLFSRNLSVESIKLNKTFRRGN